MIHARVAGTGSFLPGNPVTNNDLVARGIDTSDEWIRTRSGIERRHFAAEGETTSQLAVKAAQAALADAGLAATDIDAIVVATSTPDFGSIRRCRLASEPVEGSTLRVMPSRARILR